MIAVCMTTGLNQFSLEACILFFFYCTCVIVYQYSRITIHGWVSLPNPAVNMEIYPLSVNPIIIALCISR